MGRSMKVLTVALILAASAATMAAPHFLKKVDVTITEEKTTGACCNTCSDPYNKYFSIADDSGPWLCGETCIRDSYYWIFHVFEKNLTKASSQTASVCHDNGYTIYNSTVTHGGGGLYCTLDLYECAAGSGKCPRPDAFAQRLPKP